MVGRKRENRSRSNKHTGLCAVTPIDRFEMWGKLY